MTENQMHILQHSLGMDRRGLGEIYRNYFTADPGHSDWADLQILVDCMYMQATDFEEGGSTCKYFVVTEAGRQTVLDFNRKRFKEVYQEELAREVRDHPENYLYHLDQVSSVVDRMVRAFMQGRGNKTSVAVRRTLKRLGLKSRYIDIERYLTGCKERIKFESDNYR